MRTLDLYYYLTSNERSHQEQCDKSNLINLGLFGFPFLTSVLIPISDTPSASAIYSKNQIRDYRNAKDFLYAHLQKKYLKKMIDYPSTPILRYVETDNEEENEILLGQFIPYFFDAFIEQLNPYRLLSRFSVYKTVCTFTNVQNRQFLKKIFTLVIDQNQSVRFNEIGLQRDFVFGVHNLLHDVSRQSFYSQYQNDPKWVIFVELIIVYSLRIWEATIKIGYEGELLQEYIHSILNFYRLMFIQYSPVTRNIGDKKQIAKIYQQYFKLVENLRKQMRREFIGTVMPRTTYHLEEIELIYNFLKENQDPITDFVVAYSAFLLLRNNVNRTELESDIFRVPAIYRKFKSWMFSREDLIWKQYQVSEGKRINYFKGPKVSSNNDDEDFDIYL